MQNDPATMKALAGQLNEFGQMMPEGGKSDPMIDVFAGLATEAATALETAAAEIERMRGGVDEPDEDVIEFVARTIHDADDMADTVWPDGEGDDGYRGDRAYVRLCPNPEAFRQAARQAISAYHAARSAIQGGEHE